MKRIAMMMMMVVVMLALACGPGPEGPMGPAGPAGPQGPAGEPGVRLNSVYSCSLLAGGATFYHESYLYSDNSVMSTCTIQDASAEYTAISMYLSSQPGSEIGYCQLTYDWDDDSSAWNGGFWQFSMNRAAVTGVAAYADSSSPYNGLRYNLNCRRYQ